MAQLLENIFAQGDGFNFILLIGIALFFGTVGARIFQKFNIPQIIGYISIGIILGPMLFGIISQQTVETFESFNLFALGIIGFLIGGELKRDVFVKFGKQVFAILIFEGLTAFFLVGLLSFGLMLCFYEWQTALAVGSVLGAICAATDPASTVNVLWEYRTRGPLTTMLTAIVALDDALALVLYITSVSLAGVLMGQQHDGGILTIIFHALYEIIGSLGLGVIAGFVLRWLIVRVDDEKIMVFTIATVALTAGLAKSFGMDVILSCMALGVTLINISPRHSLKSFELMRRFSVPVYVLFFVLIGSRLNVSGMNIQIWLLVIVYVIGSIIGKTSGAYWGAAYSHAVPTVKKYLGFCLYQQGTIAIALLVMASTRFQSPIRETMLTVIVIGVFILQLIGPLCVKIWAKKAGEVGMNFTEDDLIKTHNVADVMDAKVPVISAGMDLAELIKVVSRTDSFYYPVVDNDNNLIGAVTLDGIRNTFTTQELNDWLVALDIAEPVVANVTGDMQLSEAFEKAKRLDLEHIPVVDPGNGNRFVGILNCRGVHRQLSAEVLERQRKADSIR